MAAIKINIKGNSKSKAKKKVPSLDKGKPKSEGVNNKNSAKESLFADSGLSQRNNDTENAIPVTSFSALSEEEDLTATKNEDKIDLEYIANIKPASEESGEPQGDTDKSISLMKSIGFSDEEILQSFR